MTQAQDIVAQGYDAVYAALPNSPTLLRIWREHVLGPDYPEDFEHINFLSLAELRELADEQHLAPGSSIVDLACGMGGPSLWIAREEKATLTGIDISSVAVAAATARAARLGLTSVARFQLGSFAGTRLPTTSADAVMSIDALQYAPDKAAALAEAARILRPGGRLAFAVFELEPERAAGLPILGSDPTSDYGPLLAQAGFTTTRYDELPGWQSKVTTTYEAIVAAKDTLMEEMGAPAAMALLTEVSLTLERQPYRRHVLIAATKS